MTALPVSVIVVSRGRPAFLKRCLTGIGQLCYPAFEIVVVADPEGCAAVRAMGWAERVKLVPFDAANISAARNAGIAAAAGEVVAFIDDDAVPEPSWLDHLAAPFADAGVTATGGYVIGRNGISFQWRARAADSTGQSISVPHRGDAPFEPDLPEGFVPKTEGTNSAFRRAPLAAMGGFDPAFRFFLDETDVNLRLARAGARTVIVPLARVHHGYAASDRRAGDRAPRDLTEIGASSAVFLRKHAPDADVTEVRVRLCAEQRRGLLRYLVDGGLEPRDIGRLLAGLEAGLSAGMARSIDPLAPLGPATAPFLAFRRDPATGRALYFAGRPWNRRALRRAAARAVAAGDVVTVFRFSPTALPHRVRFVDAGWWEQRGGVFGRAIRSGPVFQLQGFRRRVQKEWANVEKLRKCQNDVTIS